MIQLNGIAARAVCLVIGYVFGMFLTAEVVTRKLTGKPCSELGTSGNPGMANVMSNLGFKPGITVLAGDLLKTILAALIAWLLFGETLGRLGVYYAGLGVTLGHNFPAWNRFHGGKGVTTTCMTLPLVHFWWGLAADIAGMLVVFISQYLCIGAIVIPAFFLIPCVLFWGTETTVLTLIMTAMMALRHMPAVLKIRTGETARNDVLSKIVKGIRGAGSKVKTQVNRYSDSGNSGPADTEVTQIRPDKDVMEKIKLNSSGNKIVREHILFYGQVQGVGFRYQAVHAARQLGLTGRVENLPDGSVEMEVQGKPLEISRLTAYLRRGNWIRIDHMDVEDMPLKEDEHTFRVTGYY